MRASLSAVEARGLALRAQLFTAPSSSPITLLDRLGAIQLDSVNVLARNHLLVPLARLGAYSVDELYQSIYTERLGFEYWGHMASWLPMRDYRYFLPRMARIRANARDWWRSVREQNAPLYPLIVERIRAEGPLGATAFEDPRPGRGTWWDWKPAKLVLEDLLDMGDLMCAARTAGFARLYDLAERVLPAGLDVSDPGEEAANRYLMLRGLDCLGVATVKEIADYYRLRQAPGRPRLASLLKDTEAVQVEVEGWNEPAFTTPAFLEGPLDLPEHPPTFLAPFDNLMWHRDRVERIFGFRYRVEIYVPEPKRQYGYYVLPLLARGELVGRADLKLDRQASVLRVRRLHLDSAEPGEAESALETLATQLGVADIDMP